MECNVLFCFLFKRLLFWEEKISNFGMRFVSYFEEEVRKNFLLWWLGIEEWKSFPYDQV